KPCPLDGRATIERGSDNALDHIDGNREPDPDAAARARVDCGIQADQLAIEIDQSAAGIARILGGVRLDEEAVVADPNLRTRERRNDALGHRLPDAERIADRNDEIADLERVRIAQFEHWETPAALEPKHREIGARVAQHDLGLKFAPV